MNNLQAIETAVQELAPADRARFRAWFEQFDAADWDRQLEHDVTSGALDWLAAEALADLDSGRCTDR